MAATKLTESLDMMITCKSGSKRPPLEKIISNRPVLLLLGGPSLYALEGEIEALRDTDVLFCAVNHKHIAEEKILSKIGRQVDIWFIYSTTELRILAGEIIEFLKREANNYFITTSEEFEFIYQVKESYRQEILPYKDKLIFMDKLRNDIFKAVEVFPPNTCSMALSYIISKGADFPVFLLGCDGVADENYSIKESYYSSGNMEKYRKKKGSSVKEDIEKPLTESDLYTDQINFHKNWPLIEKNVLLSKKYSIPDIFNANPNSYYTAFRKCCIEDFINYICEGSPMIKPHYREIEDKVRELELTPVGQRDQLVFKWVSALRMLSNFAWDIHSFNSYELYARDNKPKEQSKLQKRGYFTGKLSDEDTKLLREAFESCEKQEFRAEDFKTGYFFEPRENLHEAMRRINTYYKPSDKLIKQIEGFLSDISKTIEEQAQHYWRVGSFRVFRVNPVDSTQGFHLDGWPVAIKKIFFYPNGVGESLGSTQIKTKDKKEEIIEGGPGTWVIFENSLVLHQAFSSPSCAPRPTIEIDLVPALVTNTKIDYAGINSWYPWFPVEVQEGNIAGKYFTEERISNRVLLRTSGLTTLLREQHRFDFELDFSDYDALENIAKNCSKYSVEDVPAQNEVKNNYHDFNSEIQRLISHFGRRNFVINSVKYALRWFKNRLVRVVYKITG